MEKDFIYLNIPKLIHRNMLCGGESMPVPQHKEKTLEWLKVLIEFFIEQNLFNENSPVWQNDLENLVVKLSDLNETGQGFVMAQHVEKWLSAWDRQKNKFPEKDIPADKDKLNRRLRKYLKKENK